MGQKVEVKPGTVFHKWTVLGEVAGVANKNRRLLLCKCTCGQQAEVFLGHLRNGASAGCRQCQTHVREAVTVGAHYGRWTVLCEGTPRGYSRYILCRCECGQEVEVLFKSLKQGVSSKCRRCMRDYAAVGEITSSKWVGILRGAASRGLDVKVTTTEVWQMYLAQERRCALSGLPIGMKTDASLDRIDSSRGYYLDNVQWVHKHVNMMKRSLSQGDFIALCHAISETHPVPAGKPHLCERLSSSKLTWNSPQVVDDFANVSELVAAVL